MEASHIAVDSRLAQGLRKRVVRESAAQFDVALEGIFGKVLPLGCQRRGATQRRLIAFMKERYAGCLIRERRAGSGRQEVWSADLLLPEDSTAGGGFELVRLDISRRDPGSPEFTRVGVRVTQHAIERMLQRNRECGWNVRALTTELRPALEILSKWSDERLFEKHGHWHLPTSRGLAFLSGEGSDIPIHLTTWVREDQLREEQRHARAEILRRLSSYHSTGLQRSIRLVCGPKTPLIQARRGPEG